MARWLGTGELCSRESGLALLSAPFLRPFYCMNSCIIQSLEVSLNVKLGLRVLRVKRARGCQQKSETSSGKNSVLTTR